jgi:hypothetical protein
MRQSAKTGPSSDRVRTQTDTQGAGRAEAAAFKWTHLYLIIEADHPLLGGVRYSVVRVDEVLFGRGAERSASRSAHEGKTSLRIAVQNPRASEAHARLFRDATRWLIEDLGSKNGTFVNGNRIIAPAEVFPGDIIKIGRAFFMLGESLLPAAAPLSEDLRTTDAGSCSLPGFPTIVPALAELLRKMRPAIESADPITIVGETGTGKDVLAEAIHAASRPSRPFIAMNCASLTASLVEGQLFGYVKGAYSGADRSDPGFVRLADGGTLFLDEILDLPLPGQAKLLRVLQQKEVVPLGTARVVRVDVRFIAASQRPFSEGVDGGRFRLDLKARLEPHVVELFPLRERPQDIGLLVAAILRKLGAKESDGLTISSKGVWQILGHSWPDNIRGLENALLRAYRFARDGMLDETAFPVPASAPARIASKSNLSTEDRDLRNQLIVLLKKYGGNVTDVAKELVTNRPQVYRWCGRFGIEHASFRADKPVSRP